MSKLKRLREIGKKLKKKKPLSPNEVKILRALFHTRLPLSQYEIAKKADISWGTVKKYAPRLKADKLIVPKQKQLSFNFDLFWAGKKKKKRKGL